MGAASGEPGPAYHSCIQDEATFRGFYDPRERIVLVIPVGGSSNSEGRNDSADNLISIRPLYPHHALMPDTGVRVHPDGVTSLVPLVETPADGRRETLCSAMVNTFIRSVENSFGYRPRVATFLHGASSRSYRKLTLGSRSHELFKRTLSDIVRIARASGDTVIVPACIWVHGEADAAEPEWRYRQYMVQHQARIAADIRQITGQSAEPLLMMTQMSATHRLRPDHPDFEAAGPALAQVALHGHGPFRCLDGLYECPVTEDGLHLSSEGQNILGHKIGRKLFDELCGHGATCFRVVSGHWRNRRTFRLHTSPPSGVVRILRDGSVAETVASRLGFEATGFGETGRLRSLTRDITVQVPGGMGDRERVAPGAIDITFPEDRGPIRSWNLYWGMRGDTTLAANGAGLGNGPIWGGRTLIADTADAPSLQNPNVRFNNWLTAGQMLEIAPTF